MSITVYNTTDEVGAAGSQLAILPIGSIEQHGRHLPLATDWLTAEHVAREVAARLDCYLLPGVPFSCSLEHLGRSGTIAIQPETLMAYVRDIVDSLGRHGFSRVVLLNGHGGNFILKPAVRERNLRVGGPKTILVTTFMAPDPDLAVEGTLDRHAGEWETSIVMALDASLVKQPLAEDSVPEVGIEFCDYVRWEELTGNGVWGRPSRATEEKGELFLRRAVEFLVKYIPQAFERIERYERAEVDVPGSSNATVQDRTAHPD